MERTGNAAVVVGEISGLHGLEGWVKVLSYTQPRDNISRYSPWRVGGRPLLVEQSKRQGKAIVVKLEGIDHRDAAEPLVGHAIEVDRASFEPLQPGHYYWTDLIGLKVINTEGKELGRVASLLETGAHDVLVVAGERERLIPFALDAVVKSVDLESGTVCVDWDDEY